MRTNSTIHLLIFLFVVVQSGCQKKPAPYLGETPPGSTPKLFAPNMISTQDKYEFGSVFNRDADKFYYAIRLDTNWNASILFTEFRDGVWAEPKPVSLDALFSYNDPFLSFDEQRLYFMSTRPIDARDENPKDADLWYLPLGNPEMTDPVNLGAPVNSDKNEFYVSLTTEGALFYSSKVPSPDSLISNYDIFCSHTTNGKFIDRVRLSDSVNSPYFEVDPFVSPDETYIIFCSSKPGGYGEGDLYVSFKENGSWSNAINLGASINTTGHEFCPFVTRDGKYLFYTSNGDIYWVSTGFLDTLSNH